MYRILEKDREDIEYVNIIESYFICCVIMCFFFIMKKIKKAKLKIEYALFWIVSSILLLILSIFPQIAYFFADICGIKSPVNFIFLFSIMVLFVHNFYLTLRISNLDNMINSLTEEIAVRNYYKKEEENESK